MRTVTFFRLCSRAPWTMSCSVWLMSSPFYRGEQMFASVEAQGALALGHLDLTADLAARVLRRMHVDVRGSRLDLRDLGVRQHPFALLPAVARTAERERHGAGLSDLPDVDVRRDPRPRQVRERELPRDLRFVVGE